MSLNIARQQLPQAQKQTSQSGKALGVWEEQSHCVFAASSKVLKVEANNTRDHTKQVWKQTEQLQAKVYSSKLQIQWVCEIVDTAEERSHVLEDRFREIPVNTRHKDWRYEKDLRDRGAQYTSTSREDDRRVSLNHEWWDEDISSTAEYLFTWS